MRRTGFDERRDQAIADEYTKDFMPCSFCGCSTERETLVEYGARCGPCFTQYVTQGRPNPPMPSQQQRLDTIARLKRILAGAKPAGRAWAYALRDREQASEKLSRVQRGAWRAALRAAEEVAA